MRQYDSIFIKQLADEIAHDIETSSHLVIKVFPFDLTEQFTEAVKNDERFSIGVVSIDDYGFSPTDIAEGSSIIDVYKTRFPDKDICNDDDLEELEARNVLPRQSDFEGLREFVDDMNALANLLIVHCAAGVSRSPAVASAIEHYLGFEDTIWTKGLDECDFVYKPNNYVYRLALLELYGK